MKEIIPPSAPKPTSLRRLRSEAPGDPPEWLTKASPEIRGDLFRLYVEEVQEKLADQF